MWILWNVSVCKCLHTLLNCLWELGLLFLIRIWWNSYCYTVSIKSKDILIIYQSFKVITPMRAHQKRQIISHFKTILLLIKEKWLLFTLSVLLSFEFCGTNQIVSVFILYLNVNENVTCSFLWEYGAVTIVYAVLIKV